MVLQVGIAAWGFNAIKVFERYTMPVILLIMAVMTALAVLRIDIKWQAATATGLPAFAAATQLMTAIGIGWGISWLRLCLGLHPLHQTVTQRRQGLPGDVPGHVPADGMARLPWCSDRL